MPEIRPAQLAERLRQSLFVIPGLSLLVGAVLGEAVIRLDRRGVASWLPKSYETTSENARAVLGAIAAGTITVVTLVLTLTLVAIQLASGQRSPRTIVNFLGDRFQQATVGVVLGTASYSLLALRSVRVETGDDGLQPPDLTVLVGVGATLISLAMLVFSVDRTAKRLSVGTLVRDVADETCRLIRHRYDVDDRIAVEQPTRVAANPPDASSAAVTTVAAAGSGWVQFIDEGRLLDALPEGVGVELLRPVGTFVLEGMDVVRIAAPDVGDQICDRVRQAVAIGESRTMQQDVSYGITRLNDIGLRALSPGVNDPNTAREVVLRLAQVILALQAFDLDEAEIEVDGHRIRRHGAPTHDAFVHEAFDQIRRAAVDDIAVLRTIERSLDTVLHECDQRRLPGSVDELQRQRDLVRSNMDGDDAADDLDELLR